MESCVAEIEALVQEKISLYRALLATVQQEREILLASDVDTLWHISKKKQALASEIEGIRRKILVALSEDSIAHDMSVSGFQISKILPLLPAKSCSLLHTLNVTLNILNDSINGLVKENRRFVEEYLGMVNDLVGIITGAGQPASVSTNGRCIEGRNQPHLLLSREV